MPQIEKKRVARHVVAFYGDGWSLGTPFSVGTNCFLFYGAAISVVSFSSAQQLNFSTTQRGLRPQMSNV